RGTYAIIGFVGFAIKHNLDRFTATLGFHRPWNIFNYWEPIRGVASTSSLSPEDLKFLATMVATALPFIWIGVVQTIKRLRDVGWPLWLVVLFFAPFLNLAFFLALCLVPEAGQQAQLQDRTLPGWTRFFPESKLGSAAISMLVTVPLGVAITLLGTQILTQYGWGLF